jgi:D-glucosaminate-6-phosphate ammonia-lyase
MIQTLRQLFSRRDLFRGGTVLGASALLRGPAGAAAPESGLRIGPDLYASIGVRPIVNCKGTFTIVSGSQSLPEVKRAMDEASRYYVHLDELMDGVGRRLAELTGAEWGIVTAGCAAALTHATAACIAGADPEKMQRLPNLAGLKNEVIMPRYSRNVYDHAVRMLGVRTVEVSTPAELDAAINPKTAMIMILAGPGETGPLGTEPVAAVAKARGVPLIVDAAAERLTFPNIHLQRGATMVAYSGGKCLRGPQCAGVLLGRKDLLQAAWLNSAPHHAFGRSLKVGKEEIMGMLAAVEMWKKRDHEAEWKQWESWLAHIAARVAQVSGVTTEVLLPQGLSNNAPRLRINWDGGKLGITGQEVEKLVYTTEPRMVLSDSNGTRRTGAENSWVTIMPYMMMPGDEKVAAERLYAVLSKPPRIDIPATGGAPAANAGGQWEAHLEFVCGSADHTLVFEQQGTELVGTHTGDLLAGDLRGYVEGNDIWFRSSHKYEGTRLGYEFAGKLNGDAIEGTVGLEEYGQARFVARRHRYGAPGGVVRPVKNT